MNAVSSPMSQILQMFRSEGRLPGPSQALAGATAQQMVERETTTFNHLREIDDLSDDLWLGQGVVETYHSGGGMGLPSSLSASYRGDTQDGQAVRHQKVFLMSERSPMAHTATFTTFTPDKLSTLEITAGPQGTTARAYDIDRQNPGHSTVQEYNLMP